MAASSRDLRRKIKSISGTKKLTQAMQMVAASKMQRAIKAAESSRDYSNLAWQIIQNIKTRINISEHPLLTEHTLSSSCLILVTSNRGLCGALNAQVIKIFNSYIHEMESKKIKIKIITIGNKGKIFTLRHYKELLIADFPVPDRTLEFADITPIAKVILDDYEKANIDNVVIFYNDFISTLKQSPTQKQLLPIPKVLIESQAVMRPGASAREYFFEPDVNSILDVMLPTVLKIQLQQSLLESSASEHSARMIAMKNATDNARDLIDDLTLTYNSIRQAAITKEISEISAGAEALKI